MRPQTRSFVFKSEKTHLEDMAVVYIISESLFFYFKAIKTISACK
jgi:hypothetical protein